MELDSTSDIAAFTQRRDQSLGIGMVHQHFMLVPTLTVLENLILGNEIAGRGVLNLRRRGPMSQNSPSAFIFPSVWTAKLANFRLASSNGSKSSRCWCAVPAS